MLLKKSLIRLAQLWTINQSIMDPWTSITLLNNSQQNPTAGLWIHSLHPSIQPPATVAAA
jgi:hypothetical protein